MMRNTPTGRMGGARHYTEAGEEAASSMMMIPGRMTEQVNYGGLDRSFTVRASRTDE